MPVTNTVKFLFKTRTQCGKCLNTIFVRVNMQRKAVANVENPGHKPDKENPD